MVMMYQQELVTLDKSDIARAVRISYLRNLRQIFVINFYYHS